MFRDEKKLLLVAVGAKENAITQIGVDDTM